MVQQTSQPTNISITEDEMVMQRSTVPKEAEAMREDDLPPQVVDAYVFSES